MRVSAAEAARLREASDAASKAARRLHLVLDLDHTLLNSTRLDEIPRDSCGEAMEALIRPEDAEVAANGGEKGGGGGGEEGSKSESEKEKEKPFPFQSLPAFPPHPSRSLFYLPAINLWTKLRPGTRAFLAKCSEKYELAVYTHGDRAYAAAMARLLDPTGELFGGRVISQGDSTRAHHKSLDVVLGSDLTTLILDDTRAVWPQHEGNLLLVDRYIFFPACAGRFFSLHSPPPPPTATAAAVSGGAGSKATTTTPPPPPLPERPLSWLEKAQDEDLSTGMLSVAARVLDAVHESYFKELDEEEEKEKEKKKKERENGGGGGGGGETKTTPPTKATTADVRKHLHALRSSILQGCVIVLSGMAPMGTPLDAVPAARTARALGAAVEERLVAGRTDARRRRGRGHSEGERCQGAQRVDGLRRRGSGSGVVDRCCSDGGSSPAADLLRLPGVALGVPLRVGKEGRGAVPCGCDGLLDFCGSSGDEDAHRRGGPGRCCRRCWARWAVIGGSGEERNEKKEERRKKKKEERKRKERTELK